MHQLYYEWNEWKFSFPGPNLDSWVVNPDPTIAISLKMEGCAKTHVATQSRVIDIHIFAKHKIKGNLGHVKMRLMASNGQMPTFSLSLKTQTDRTNELRCLLQKANIPFLNINPDLYV